MALSNCKECGAQISSDAKACPHCGSKKPAGIVAQLAVVVLTMLIIAPFLDFDSAPSAPVSAEQVQKERQQEDLFIAGWGKLKRSMLDPSSFDLISATYVEKTNATCYKFRANNAFGGKAIGHGIYVRGNLYTNSDAGFNARYEAECLAGGPVRKMY